MADDYNKSNIFKEELIEIINDCKKYYQISDNLIEVQQQFKESAQRQNQWQSQADETLKAIRLIQEKFENTNKKFQWEELNNQLISIQNKLENLKLDVEEKADKFKVIEERLNTYIDNNQSNYATLSRRIDAIEEKRENEIRNFVSSTQYQDQTEIRENFVVINNQLKQFEQKQTELSHQISQLNNTLNNYQQERKLVFSQLEKIYGLNLAERIRLDGVLPLPQAVKWMLQTCNIINDLHQLNPPLIYGNIQPSNILVREQDKRVFVINLKDMYIHTNNATTFSDYSAPEQQQGKLMPQSDIFAIASTLIFLLTGKNPKDFYIQQEQSYFFKLEGIAVITPQLQQVIWRATEFNPDKRYQTVKEFIKDLAACLPR